MYVRLIQEQVRCIPAACSDQCENRMVSGRLGIDLPDARITVGDGPDACSSLRMVG